MRQTLSLFMAVALGSAALAQENTSALAPGAIAIYNMQGCSPGSLLQDLSGHGNNAVYAGSASWTCGALGATGIGGGGYWQLPSSITQQFRTIQVYAEPPVVPGSGNRMPLVSQVGSGFMFAADAYSNSWPPNDRPTLGESVSGMNAPSSVSFIRPGLLTFVVPDDGNGRIYINSSETPYCAYPTTTPFCYPAKINAAPNRNGQPMFIGHGGIGSSGGDYIGTISYIVIYDRALSDSDVAQNASVINAWINARRGGPPPQIAQQSGGPVLAILGNSKDGGQVGNSTSGANGQNPWVNQLTLSSSMNITNEGASGAKLTLEAPQNPETGDLWGWMWNVANPGKSILVIGDATNDLCVGISPQTIYQSVLSLVAAAKRDGYPAVIVETQDSVWCAESARAQYNALVTNGAASNGYYFADVAGDPRLGAPNASQNTQYFTDGAHETTAGYQIKAGIIGAVINQILAANFGVSGPTGNKPPPPVTPTCPAGAATIGTFCLFDDGNGALKAQSLKTGRVTTVATQ